MTQKIKTAVIDTSDAVDGQFLKNVAGTATWANAPLGGGGPVDLTNVTTDIIPSLDSVYNIGSADKRWNEIFVSANTIYLGDSTVLSGTSIIIDGGENPTALSQMPTLKASKIVAAPYTYNPGGGTVTVRPSIEFEVGGQSYPISFNTETLEFSLDAQGNYGTGSMVAKKVTLSNAAADALSVVGGIAHTGSYLNTDSTKTFRFDGNMTLGLDATKTVTVKGAAIFQGGVQFEGATSIGDGNDNVTINAGVNSAIIAASNFSVDTSGNVVVQGNLTVQGTTTTINSNTLNIGDNIVILNADLPGGEAPTQDAGIQVARGTEAAARWLWNETTDAWSPMGGNISGVGSITATSFVGNADTATKLATARNINGIAFDGSSDITIPLSGSLAGSGLTLPTATIAGRTSAGTGAVEALAGSQVTALLSVFSASAKGLTPPSPGGTATFLRADGSWATPATDVGSVAWGAITGNLFDQVDLAAELEIKLTDGNKGNITVSNFGSTWTIDANVVTMAKIEQIPTQRFLGRVSGGTGNAEILTVAQVKTALALSNVSNTSDANKPISTATQAALDLKADKGSITTSGLTANTNRLAGRVTGGAGAIEEIAIGNGLTVTGNTISVDFVDTGWETSVTAVGTGVAQNIELPESGLTVLDVIVFNDGIRYYSGEYTIVGSTLTMTSNFPGDQIEIIKMPTRTVITQPTTVRAIDTQTGTTYFPGASAANRYIRFTNGSPVTFTIPGTYPIGTELIYEQAGAGAVTVVGDTGVTIVQRENKFKTAGQYAVATLRFVGSATWVLSGDLIA